LLISRLLRDKGIYEYIEAIKLIKHRYPEKLIEFQLLGDSKSSNRTAIKISELEDWINKSLVNYLGVTDQVENIISECHCVLLPSYREGMPRSILEAFAIGRPVIVSDVPGCRDIVDHKTNGLLCKVKSSEDLARKMITMMRISQDTRNKLAKNGRKKVESFFDEKIVIKAYLKVINDIVSHEKIF
jgi:glycosyltransferase involved in cell wall biosynthesis